MPLEYVRSKGWAHKVKGKEIILHTCPKCQDSKWHFYMGTEESGPWKCHKCNEEGNLYQLKKFFGDIEPAIHPASKKKEYSKPDVAKAKLYHEAIWKDYEALQYLNNRGISQDSIKRFRLGVREKDGERWLAIPHTECLELANIKYRRLPPGEKTFEREFGCKSVLFNGNAISKHEDIILVEGELDCICLWQHGFQNAVAITNGAGNFDADWVLKLEKTKRVYLCYDADEEGQKGAVKTAKRLGYERCWNIVLPVKDANDFFQKKQAEDFQKLLDKASQFSLPGVISVRDAIELLRVEAESGDNKKGILTRWDNVNRIVQGWRPGDFIILSALPKTGKTTLALDITWHNVLKGVPSLFFCLEMRPERLIRKLIQHQYKCSEIELEKIHFFRSLCENVPLYFGAPKKFNKLDELFSLIEEGIKRFGIEFMVFDNLHLLCRDDPEKLGKASLGFKQLAESMEIPILVIAQPRKRENGTTEIMSAEDVKYTSSIHADCDQMVIMHRNRKASKAKDIGTGMSGFSPMEESMDPVTLIRVEAHRYGPGGETVLYFVGDQSRFEQMERKEPRIGKETSK